MAVIPPFFIKSVVALGIQISETQKRWIGTGFLVGREEENNPDQSTIYIITNRHVVENQQILFVRFNKTNDIGVTDLPMILVKDGKKLYSEHPVKESDIVAIQILPGVIVANKLELSYFSINKHALTLDQMEHTGVSEGSFVYSLGFPMNLVNNIIKAPICRLGCISQIAPAFVLGKNAHHYLIDAQIFPGNSGGPIISRPEIMSIDGTESNNSACLIGILSSYIPYQNILVSQQTGRPMMNLEENSGITIVHPVDRIREVIELEYNRVKQEASILGETEA